MWHASTRLLGCRHSKMGLGHRTWSGLYSGRGHVEHGPLLVSQNRNGPKAHTNNTNPKTKNREAQVSNGKQSQLKRFQTRREKHKQSHEQENKHTKQEILPLEVHAFQFRHEQSPTTRFQDLAIHAHDLW